MYLLLFTRALIGENPKREQRISYTTLDLLRGLLCINENKSNVDRGQKCGIRGIDLVNYRSMLSASCFVKLKASRPT